jgi:regulatory protein
LSGPRRARSGFPARDDVTGRTPRTAKDRALGLLAVRWRSRQELERRLAQAGFQASEIEEALQDLESTGLIDDARFARELVRSHGSGRLSGDRALRMALTQKGVTNELQEEAIAEAGDESERARELAAKRAARLASLPPETAYRRLHDLLLRRGYPPGLARDAARAALADTLAAYEATPDDG